MAEPRAGAPDFAGDSAGVTIAIPACDEHPPLSEWPEKNLITGQCPSCGCGGIVDGWAAARVLKGRRLGQQALDV
jgi:hypothetical protein